MKFTHLPKAVTLSTVQQHGGTGLYKRDKAGSITTKLTVKRRSFT
ncbi:hypothetical protein [Pontixanthobacter sp. CEM42]|nr:hypothetical protein [Pontixanthobacter sp. CEM42]